LPSFKTPVGLISTCHLMYIASPQRAVTVLERRLEYQGRFRRNL
jgi:hypothetical protein